MAGLENLVVDSALRRASGSCLDEVQSDAVQLSRIEDRTVEASAVESFRGRAHFHRLGGSAGWLHFPG